MEIMIPNFVLKKQINMLVKDKTFLGAQRLEETLKEGLEVRPTAACMGGLLVQGLQGSLEINQKYMTFRTVFRKCKVFSKCTLLSSLPISFLFLCM